MTAPAFGDFLEKAMIGVIGKAAQIIFGLTGFFGLGVLLWALIGGHTTEAWVATLLIIVGLLGALICGVVLRIHERIGRS